MWKTERGKNYKIIIEKVFFPFLQFRRRDNFAFAILKRISVRVAKGKKQWNIISSLNDKIWGSFNSPFQRFFFSLRFSNVFSLPTACVPSACSRKKREGISDDVCWFLNSYARSMCALMVNRNKIMLIDEIVLWTQKLFPRKLFLVHKKNDSSEIALL